MARGVGIVRGGASTCAGPGASSIFLKRASIWGSLTGAHRPLRAINTSLRSASVECNGEDEGGSGSDRSWMTGWVGGRSGDSVVRMSKYSSFNRERREEGSGDDRERVAFIYGKYGTIRYNNRLNAPHPRMLYEPSPRPCRVTRLFDSWVFRARSLDESLPITEISPAARLLWDLSRANEGNNIR